MTPAADSQLDRPLSLGGCATLACLWEATAPKPGNVHHGADFDDLTYVDFLTSAAVIGPIIEWTGVHGVGATVRAAVRTTRAAVGTNTNLGMLLLIAPLAAVSAELTLPNGIAAVLNGLNVDDTRRVYEAIRIAKPGGLGKVGEADVNAADVPPITLLEAMRLAADRDLVARQYVNQFTEVFWTADRIAAHAANGLPLSPAIVRAYLELLAAHPDTLIARKCGVEIAAEVSSRAAVLLDSGEGYESALADFDHWLRADGHRRNPGTSADVVAAALFVLLRDGRLNWPVKFY